MPLPPITTFGIVLSILVYLAIRLWALSREKIERARPRPFETAPVFLVLFYALELTQGSWSWMYGLLGLFVAGRLLQAAAVDTRVPVRLSFLGTGVCLFAMAVVILMLMRPLL